MLASSLLAVMSPMATHWLVPAIGMPSRARHSRAAAPFGSGLLQRREALVESRSASGRQVRRKVADLGLGISNPGFSLPAGPYRSSFLQNSSSKSRDSGRRRP